MMQWGKSDKVKNALPEIDLKSFFEKTAPEYEVTECYFEHFDCRAFWIPERIFSTFFVNFIFDNNFFVG